MRSISGLVAILTVPLAALSSPANATAQDTDRYLGYVTESFHSAPAQRSLLSTAIAEAEIAARHAELATQELGNLEAMQLHAGHVLHAVYPLREQRSDSERAEDPSGPGLGYGVKKAADLMVQYIQRAAAVEGAPEPVVTYSRRIATVASNTARLAVEIGDLAVRVQAAITAAEAAPLIEQMNAKAALLLSGVDSNSDGTVSWQQGEGGLETAQALVEVMRSAMR